MVCFTLLFRFPFKIRSFNGAHYNSKTTKVKINDGMSQLKRLMLLFCYFCTQENGFEISKNERNESSQATRIGFRLCTSVCSWLFARASALTREKCKNCKKNTKKWMNDILNCFERQFYDEMIASAMRATHTKDNNRTMIFASTLLLFCISLTFSVNLF